jgi:AraC-like DNA-binding protein
MDPLSDVIAGMNIRGAQFTRLEATAPWGWASRGDPVVKFVLVVRGSAVLTTSAHPEPIRLCGIMFDADPYRMFDDEASQTIDCVEVEKLRVGNRIEVGGGGALTSFVSGFFHVDTDEVRPLLSVLPKLLHLKLDQSRSLAFQSVLELLALETERPGLGSEAVVSRLFELLFVHALRAYSAQPQELARGWLAALSDRQLALSLEAMHANFAANWTVEGLARTAGMSRSAFASRFKSVVGQAPLEYLTAWRVHRAVRLLQQRNVSISEVAERVGYESVAAFSRIFKRETGLAPGAFRRTLLDEAA